MQEEQLIQTTIDESVVHYAKLAKNAGLDGVVCSVLEAKEIVDACGEEFLRVTPGIRLAEGEAHDQIRVATPVERKTTRFISYCRRSRNYKSRKPSTSI